MAEREQAITDMIDLVQEADRKMRDLPKKRKQRSKVRRRSLRRALRRAFRR